MKSIVSNYDASAGQIVVKPHNHDVLCGRGGLTNQHPGNEWFRRLVRSNRALYRSCPKHTKLLVAKAIVQAVQQQEPSGRFLEVADKDAGTWRQINYKRAVDKTSQALREKDTLADTLAVGNPHALTSEVAKLAADVAARKGKKKVADLSDLAQATLRQAGLQVGNSRQQSSSTQFQEMDQARKRKAQASMATDFLKPLWWRQGAGQMSANLGSHMVVNGNKNNTSNGNKRMRTDFAEEAAPLPTEPLQVRQSSLFRFLNGSGIFGRRDSIQQQHIQQGFGMNNMQQKQGQGIFAFSGVNSQISSQLSSQQQPRLQPNPSELISLEASAFENGTNNSTSMNLNMNMTTNSQRPMGIESFDPLPMNGNSGDIGMSGMHSSNGMFVSDLKGNDGQSGEMDEMPTNGLFPAGMENVQGLESLESSSNLEATPPPMNRLTSQVSDWLTTFWPLGKEPQPSQQMQQQARQATPPPPGGGEKLERSMSSTFFNLVRSPSQFLTSLKTGVTSMFGGDDLNPRGSFMMNNNSNASNIAGAVGNNLQGSVPIMGTASSTAKDSLLDDYEETPLETRLRSVSSV